MRAGDHVLVAVSFDAPSVIAMLRGIVLARHLRADLRLLHVIWDRPGPRDVIGRVRTEDAARVVVDWAASIGIAVPHEHVDVRSGSPDVEIARATSSHGPKILVLGGRSVKDPAAPGHVARYVTRNTSVPVLVAAPPSASRSIVAASDLRDERYPVLHAASDLALATAGRAIAVHNVGERTGAGAREHLRELVRSLEGFEDGHVTHARSAATAIEFVANATDADLVVVGVRDGRGETLGALLSSELRSIVAIPLAPAPS